MALDGINGVQGNNQIPPNSKQNVEQLAQKIQIQMNKFEGGIAQKKITEQDTEKALNEPSAGKATLGLLEKSPVGEGNQQSREEIEALGYTFTQTAYHIGAPVTYESPDGGTITVYNGKGTKEMGENERKTVYKNGNYEQVTYYDENGKFKKCDIKIKNPVTGLTDPFGMLTMFYNKKGERVFISGPRPGDDPHIIRVRK